MKWVCIALFILIFPLSGASQELARGEIIDKVLCASDSSQSYGLYLPTGYSAEKQWPIVYAFDPGGRGRNPVERFKDSAERMGYIVVGSNNSRNGIGGDSIGKIIQALWSDTHTRFSIDERRVYATGFSGGARVANRFAMACGGCITGVISCGGSFPPELAPKTRLPYLFYGVTGIDDFNFGEVTDLARKLDQLGSVNRVATFDGPHQWPPNEAINAAMLWLEVQAAKSGVATPRDPIIDAALASDIEALKKLNQPAQIAERYDLLKKVVADFDGLRDVKGYASELTTLERSKELKKAMDDRSKQLDREYRKAAEITGLATDLSSRELYVETLGRIRSEMKLLHSMSQRQEDSGDRRYARRTLSLILISTFETASYVHAPQKKYDLAIANLEIACEAAIDKPWPFVELARLMVSAGRRDGAVDALEKAVDAGLKDASVL